MLLQRATMVVKKLQVDDKNNSLCQTNVSPWCYMLSFKGKNIVS